MNNVALDAPEIINHNSFAIEVNGVTIDIIVLTYSDRLFIILTEFGKIGSLISVQTNTVISGEEREDLFEIKTLFGDDKLEYHVTARALAECLPRGKPILFAIALRDLKLSTIEVIKKALLENKIW